MGEICRLLEPIGNIPSAEAAEKFHEQCAEFDRAAKKWVISLWKNQFGLNAIRPEPPGTVVRIIDPRGFG